MVTAVAAGTRVTVDLADTRRAAELAGPDHDRVVEHAALLQIIEQGAPEQATAYLNAMQTRTASKILAQIGDAALAADLLERLRVYGLEARAE